MRIKDFKLEEKKYGNLSIDLSDEYMDMNFYKHKNSNYNYIKKKYVENYNKSGNYIGLYENESDKIGYFYVCENILLKDEHIFKKYTRYMELLEFGFSNNDLNQINFLVDYLYYYCQYSGAQFIKIKTKEYDFIKFYNLLTDKFKYTRNGNYLYIKISKINFDNLKYLKVYKEDKLSIKELYHLNEIGFNMGKTYGILTLNNNQIIKINRKTRKITYPKLFIDIDNISKYSHLNEYSLALIHYVKGNQYDVINNSLVMNYKIDGLEEFELIKIGRKLLSLEKDKYIKDYQIKEEVKEFAIKVCNNTNITSIDVITDCKFIWKSYYTCLSSIWIYLRKYVDGEIEVEEY